MILQWGKAEELIKELFGPVYWYVLYFGVSVDFALMFAHFEFLGALEGRITFLQRYVEFLGGIY